MSLYLYDEALTTKISQWTAGLDVHVYSPQETRQLFSVIADETEDKPIKLPIISISRKPSFRVLLTNKEPLSYDGRTLEATLDNSAQLNAIPISISYQIDIYTRYLQDADEIVRNLIFNIVNFPKVTVNISYNGYDQPHDSTLVMSADVADNSDIPERFARGQMSRFTIELEIPDAYLWDLRIRPNVHIHEVKTYVDEYDLHKDIHDREKYHYILKRKFKKDLKLGD